MDDQLLIHEEEYRGYTIRVYYEDDPGIVNPREWDNLGTMVCWHGRYLLGDKHDYRDPESFFEELANDVDPSVEERIEFWNSGDGWTKLINKAEREGVEYVAEAAQDTANEKRRQILDKAIDENVLLLPLYLYDHSGITISTGPFSCPWDSGQVGYVYVTKKQLRDEFHVKAVQKKHWQKAEEILKQEVQVYDLFVRGEVYRYMIFDDEGDIADSCTGFLGNWEETALEEAKDMIRAFSMHTSIFYRKNSRLLLQKKKRNKSNEQKGGKTKWQA